MTGRVIHTLQKQAVVVVAFVMVTAPFLAGAADIEQLEQQLLQSEKDIQQQKVVLQQQRSLVSSIEEEIDFYVESIGVQQRELEKIETEIALLATQIEETENNIVQTKQRRARVINSLSHAIAQQHTTSQRNIFEQLLSAESFSAFYSDLVNTSIVVEETGNLTRELRTVEQQLSAQQKELQQQKDELQVAYDAQQAQVAKVEALAEAAGYNLETAEYDTKKLASSLQAARDDHQRIEAAIQQARQSGVVEPKEIPATNGEFALQWPVDSHSNITCDYLCPDYPYDWEHAAIDIAVPSGTAVYAAEDGIITQLQFDGTAATTAWIYIDHGNDVQTVYLHLREIVVQPYQQVSKGQLIGYSGGAKGELGAGPYSTGSHLHFEVRVGGLPTNPHNYLP